MAAQTSQRRLLSRVGMSYILYHVVVLAAMGAHEEPNFNHSLIID